MRPDTSLEGKKCRVCGVAATYMTREVRRGARIELGPPKFYCDKHMPVEDKREMRRIMKGIEKERD